MTSKEYFKNITGTLTCYDKKNKTYTDLGDLDEYINKLNERIEQLETSVLEYKDQEHLYWETAQNNVKLRQENEKLKKAIEILKDKVSFEVILNLCNYEEKELLKEVLSE